KFRAIFLLTFSLVIVRVRGTQEVDMSYSSEVGTSELHAPRIPSRPRTPVRGIVPPSIGREISRNFPNFPAAVAAATPNPLCGQHLAPGRLRAVGNPVTGITAADG